MHKTETLNTRIEPALKSSAERILKKLGLSNAEAIRLFYTQICLNQGLPFDIKIPNKATVAAMKEAESGKLKRFKSTEDLFKDLND
jgi:DNA-damage-inducible protein J